MALTIAACVPTVPPRTGMLQEALRSVDAQVRSPDEIVVVCDEAGLGAAATRNETIRQATTDWVAFLDDDDLWWPSHLEALERTAIETYADLVYPWFEVENGWDPLTLDGHTTPFQRPFDQIAHDAIMTTCNFIPITVLVRHELLLDVGLFPLPYSAEWPNRDNEDWGMWKKLLNAGAKFVHYPERTWTWRWHSGNYSGRSWNGSA